MRVSKIGTRVAAAALAAALAAGHAGAESLETAAATTVAVTVAVGGGAKARDVDGWKRAEKDGAETKYEFEAGAAMTFAADEGTGVAFFLGGEPYDEWTSAPDGEGAIVYEVVPADGLEAYVGVLPEEEAATEEGTKTAPSESETAAETGTEVGMDAGAGAGTETEAETTADAGAPESESPFATLVPKENVPTGAVPTFTLGGEVVDPGAAAQAAAGTDAPGAETAETAAAETTTEPAAEATIGPAAETAAETAAAAEAETQTAETEAENAAAAQAAALAAELAGAAAGNGPTEAGTDGTETETATAAETATEPAAETATEPAAKPETEPETEPESEIPTTVYATPIGAPGEDPAAEFVFSLQDAESDDESYVKGAKMAIEDLSGKTVVEWTTADAPVTILGLPKGEYLVRAVAPADGWTLSEEFKFSAGTTPTRRDSYARAASVKFAVTDPAGDSLVGAKLKIVDAKGATVAEGVSAAPVAANSWEKPDPAAPWTARELKAGEYEAVAELPAGWATLEPKKFTLGGHESEEDDVRVTVVAEPVVARFSIVDEEDGSYVERAKTRLVDSDGVTAFEWSSGDRAAVATRLPTGSYSLEIDGVPPKYVLPDPTPIEVADTSDAQDFVAKLAKTVTYVTRTGAGEEAPLSGSALTLKKENGEKVESWNTDGAAKEFVGLPAGKYYVEEDVAPSGWRKADKTYFEVDQDQVPTEVTISTYPAG